VKRDVIFMETQGNFQGRFSGPGKEGESPAGDLAPNGTIIYIYESTHQRG